MVLRYDTDVVWIGRRALDAEIEAKLDAVAALCRRPHYFAADAIDETAFHASVCSYLVRIVDWGCWGSVGIVTDAFYRKHMESLGFGSIEPDEAMEALGKRWKVSWHRK